MSLNDEVSGSANRDMISAFDPELGTLIEMEERRQRRTVNLIASENFASPIATGLEGGIFSNKNAEGYPGRRYVAGCEYADAVEDLAIKRLKQLFKCEHANVQGMSATVANVALLQAVLKPGDTFLTMGLAEGGHLSHGAKFHASGNCHGDNNGNNIDERCEVQIPTTSEWGLMVLTLALLIVGSQIIKRRPEQAI